MDLIKIKPFSLVNEIPQNSIVAFDTSLVWRLYGDKDIEKDPKLKNELNYFVTGIAKRNSAIVLPIKVHEELNILSTAVVLGPKEERKAKLNADRTLMNKPMDLVDQVLTNLSKLPNFVDRPVGNIDQTILENSRRISRDLGLEHGDAVIYNIVKSIPDIDFIATFDADFHFLKDDKLTLYVPGFRYVTIKRDRQKLTENLYLD
jgi:hypothetical protein